MDILAIIPKYVRAGAYYSFPLGFMYVCASIKQAGHNVKCLNINESTEPSDKQIKGAIHAYQPDVVCSTGVVTDFNLIKDILKAVKSINENIVTVLGGGLISSRPELSMKNLDVDYGVLGEGEVTIIELLESFDGIRDVHSVNGLIYKNRGELVKTSPRSLISNLNTIPYPAYELVDYESYISSVPRTDYVIYSYKENIRPASIITSRSCPYHCTFCYHPLGRGTYRKRSIENIMGEVDYLVSRYGVNFLSVADDIFAVKPEDVYAFCEAIRTYNINWFSQLRVDLVNPKMLQAMNDAGCVAINYGVESANNTVLKSMKKRTRKDQIEAALKMTVENKLYISATVIFGDPVETWDMALETYEWARANPAFNLIGQPIYVYPVSEDYQYCLENELIKDEIAHIKARCPPVNMSQMTNEQYARLMLMYRGLRQEQFNTLFGDVETEYIGVDELTGKLNYTVSVQCPSCNEPIQYKNFLMVEVKDLTLLERYFVMCKNCRQRIDLRAMSFGHVQEAFEKKREGVTPILNELRKNGRPVCITPLVPEQTFEYVQNDLIDLGGLNIQCVLDSDPNLQGIMFNNQYSVRPQTEEYIVNHCTDCYFVVLPIHKRDIIVSNLFEYGVSSERVVELL
jgi:anaerobic magnesium-protoporphyrin IX monomethyl ester cyclase